MLESRHLVEEMPATSGEYRLASSTSLRSFSVSDVMFQFPITRLWRDCRLPLGFQVTRSKITVVWPHSPTHMRSMRKVEPPISGVTNGGERTNPP